jgi:hypothetical protein
VPTVTVANWSANFVGMESSDVIRRITVRGSSLVMDRLTFEPLGTIPESGSVMLLTFGAVILAWHRRKRAAPQQTKG